MKLLLDENLPHDLRHFIPEHEVFTVAFMGWAGLTNGKLLATASQAGFDALLTQDAGIEFQHDLNNLAISIVMLHAPTNTLDDLRPLVPAMLMAPAALSPRTLVHVSARN